MTSDSQSESGVGAWVDVNERRPETMCHVLCATDSGYVDVSFYDPTAKLDELKLGRRYCGKWGRYFDICKRGYRITHWMPLPKAPNTVITDGSERSGETFGGRHS